MFFKCDLFGTFRDIILSAGQSGVPSQPPGYGYPQGTIPVQSPVPYPGGATVPAGIQPMPQGAVPAQYPQQPQQRQVSLIVLFLSFVLFCECSLQKSNCLVVGTLDILCSFHSSEHVHLLFVDCSEQ